MWPPSPTSEGRWIQTDTGHVLNAETIAEKFGERLLRKSGVQDIPLEGGAKQVPVRHGAMLPQPLRTAQNLMAWMGLARGDLKDTPLANQRRNFEYASDVGTYGLAVALEAHTAFGRALHQLIPSSRFGAAQGSAAPGIERWVEMYLEAKAGKDSPTYVLQSALLENARGLYLNAVLPHFDFKTEVADARRGGKIAEAQKAMERILPASLNPGQMPATGGVNPAFSQACASGLYALWGARKALLREGVEGEFPMDLMMVLGADATFSPYGVAPMVAGFSRQAPMTVKDMVEKLGKQGLLPEKIERALREEGLSTDAAWEALPEPLKIKAMNEASAPFTKFSEGLVVAEGAAALPWGNFRRLIELGLWPTSRLLGIHVAAGEGGAPNLAAMDQGIVTASMVALRQGLAHGVRPQLVQAHGTSTKLNNLAELQSLHQALRYLGMDHEMAVSAIKGLVGHAMGAAGAIDMVMGVQSLLDGEAPGLFNFRGEDLDSRYAAEIPGVLSQFRFSPEPVRGIMDGILILSEGFLSSNAAAFLGRFPQDLDQAADLLRDYNFSSHEIAEWKAKAPEHRALAEENAERLRRREITHRDIALELGFNTP